MSIASNKARSTKGRRAGAGGEVTTAVIRRFARRVAEQFQPERIILFGSHARGQARPDSDVDILVVKSTPDEIGEACRIRLAVDPPFPLDLLVRTPDNLRWRLEAGDWFLREVIEQGRVLYAKTDRRMGPLGGSRHRGGAKARRRQAPDQ